MTFPNKKCKMCGLEFTPNSSHQIYCKRAHYMICPICGKSYLETNVEKFKRPPTACSKECKVKRIQQTSIDRYGILTPGNNPNARKKSKQTMRDKYGVDYAQQSKAIKQKSINTYLDRYGVDNPQKNKQIRHKTENTNIERYGSKTYLNSEKGKAKIDDIMIDKYGTTVPLRNEEIKQHWIETNIERYGETNPAKNKDVKEKAKQTSLGRYGTEHPQSSEIIKQRVKDTFMRNYGVDNCFKAKPIIDKIHKTFYDKYGVDNPRKAEEIIKKIENTSMKRYGVPYYIMLPNVAKSSGRISNINRNILNKLNEADINGQLEFTLGRKSYDIHIPQGNILIEINPSYTHTTIGNHWNEQGIDKHYHLSKTVLAEEEGYRCMHLWDWDCVSKFINLLTTKNIIYDKVTIEMMEECEAKEFIKQYSLYDVSEDINVIYIGVRYKTKIICLIGFKLIDVLTKTWDITCVEHRFNYNVYDGNRKILNYFVEKFKPNKVTAYADYSKSNGEMLDNLGFTYTRFILPNKIWSKGRHAIIDDSSILDEAMINDGWLPVYNCGYKVYELNFTQK